MAGIMPEASGSWLGTRESDLVYQTSRWQRYQWSAYKGGAHEAEALDVKGQDKIPGWPKYTRELFTRLYADEPKRLEEVDGANRWADKAHSLADEIPEFKRLRERTVGDRLWSGMAASSLGEQVFDELVKLIERKQKLPDVNKLRQQLQGEKSLQEAGVPMDSKATQEKLAEAEQEMEGFANKIDEGAMRQAVRRGVEQAQEQLDSAASDIAAFGYGVDEGTDGRGGAVEEKLKLLQKVRSSRKLAELAELAGRFRRVAAQKQRTKASHARDEVSSVNTGDDLARLLPSELVKLTRPELRLQFYRQLTERNLLCYELKGQEKQGRGPIVVCIDNSGSMAGQSEIWSKAVALGLLDIARLQKRAFMILHFDTKVGYRMTSTGSSTSWEDVLGAMEYFSGGGTDYKPALREALEAIKGSQFDKADVVLISDGCAPTDFAQRYRQEAKERGACTYGVLIGSGDLEALKAFCDKTIQIDDVGGTNAATDALFEL
jgi:uncharacterized protein with von Willebrand factor type A (vWA) domain